MGRSILAVMAGYLVMAAAVVALFAVCFPNPDVADIPSTKFMLFSLAYGFAVAIAGGTVTAWIAKRAVMKHALALASGGLIMGIISLISGWGKAPLWYQIGNMLVVVTGVMVGGYLRRRGQGIKVKPE